MIRALSMLAALLLSPSASAAPVVERPSNGWFGAAFDGRVELDLCQSDKGDCHYGAKSRFTLRGGKKAELWEEGRMLHLAQTRGAADFKGDVVFARTYKVVQTKPVDSPSLLCAPSTPNEVAVVELEEPHDFMVHPPGRGLVNVGFDALVTARCDDGRADQVELRIVGARLMESR